MPDVTVGVTHVKQQNDFYCGPATTQMVLAALGVPPAIPPTWQDRLWDYIVANTGSNRPSNATSTPSFPRQKCDWCAGEWHCWNSTPGVLKSLLNASQSVAQYSVSRHRNEESATVVLLNTLDRNLLGFALVFGWQHWLLLDGYRHGLPGGVMVGGRNLNGVYVRDPWEEDSIHYIPWEQWKDDYLSVVPCGMFKNRYVVLGGQRRAPVYAAPSPPSNLPAMELDPNPPDPWSTPIKQLLTPEEAIAGARREIEPLRESRLSIGLRSAEAVVARLVQRLDQVDRYYYIVSFQNKDADTARVIVDAFDGSLGHVSSISHEAAELPRYLSPMVASQQLRSDADRGPEALRFRVRPGTVGEHPVLVWKPCRESSSPFLPFYQLTLGDSFVYYRVDGLRFDALTEGPA